MLPRITEAIRHSRPAGSSQLSYVVTRFNIVFDFAAIALLAAAAEGDAARQIV